MRTKCTDVPVNVGTHSNSTDCHVTKSIAPELIYNSAILEYCTEMRYFVNIHLRKARVVS